TQAQDDLGEQIRQARQDLDQVRADFVAQRRLISDLQGEIDKAAKALAKEKSQNKKQRERTAGFEGLCGSQKTILESDSRVH
ncbi:unnamed protein product, partial [Aphanomyces euteiches]